jgi:hypothetical protein
MGASEIKWPDGSYHDEHVARMLDEQRERHEQQLAHDAEVAAQRQASIAAAAVLPDPAALRRTLADAIAAACTTAERRERAEAAVAGSQRAYAETKAQLEQWDDAKHRSICDRARQFATGEVDAVADPVPDSRERLLQAVNDGGAILVILQADAAAAATADKDAHAHLQRAAIDVMLHEARMVAAQVRRHIEAVDHLRADLAGLGMVLAATNITGIQFPRAALEALEMHGAPTPQPSASGPVWDARSRWSGYLRRLLDDADARLMGGE